MKLPDWMLATLACPRCLGPLSLRAPDVPEGSSSVEELECPRCHVAYTIRDGIPELLAGEARPLPTSGD